MSVTIFLIISLKSSSLISANYPEGEAPGPQIWVNFLDDLKTWVNFPDHIDSIFTLILA